ncbi:HK97 family phage prohead protease [Rhizobium sp. KVB221]|uniref:HK97 family phage prohead protease n=1 Tax=Rhizobium setariae TaxID=2801340 RepID=A0A936YIT4_9HYPH|nr:HK97 family phage prohead protease [Rhizobium setariae]MBL0371069.1 HK97 family phage prohead protease [Rhizobium setariae]
MTADAIIARRERKFARIELKTLTEAGVFSGYASLFGEVDLGKDRVERGAFLRSLARRGAGGVRMLFQHDPAEPIGAWRVIREDGRGLYVEGVLSEGVSRAREVHQLMKSRALDGLSIGFQTVRAKSEPKTGIRQILEADLWEISVVTFPMLPTARISEVKDAPAHRLRAAHDPRLLSCIVEATRRMI